MTIQINLRPENVCFFKADGGAIALVTTVRLVFSHRNEIINRSFLENLFEPVEGEQISLGEITRRAKNEANTGTGNRKFALIGDPALMLAFPQARVYTTAINEELVDTNRADTLRALARVKIKGQVRDKQNNLLENFNGIVSPKIYDKPQVLSTLQK